jgi:hypothetical protein
MLSLDLCMEQEVEEELEELEVLAVVLVRPQW